MENIPISVKHWQGASKDSWFQRLALEIPGENGLTEWHEAVGDKEYMKLTKKESVWNT